jgi:hypothetical protein
VLHLEVVVVAVVVLLATMTTMTTMTTTNMLLHRPRRTCPGLPTAKYRRTD